MEKKQTLFRASNGWTVKSIRYSVIGGLLRPDCAGQKWFEVFDKDGYLFCAYEEAERPLDAIYAVAEKAGLTQL